jgi:hypothetical protein
MAALHELSGQNILKIRSGRTFSKKTKNLPNFVLLQDYPSLKSFACFTNNSDTEEVTHVF